MSDWQDDAACAGVAWLMDPPAHLRSGLMERTALALCGRCPVRDPCRAWILDCPADPGGIGGGLTEPQRVPLRSGEPGTCRICGLTQPGPEFREYRRGSAGRDTVCRTCRNRETAARKRAARQRAREQDGTP